MRVSAGTKEYLGWGCTCPSSLKETQILQGMARASAVMVKFQRQEIDGTKMWHAWTNPDNVYRVTFHPLKEGKRCKHAMACAADVVGDWLTEGFQQLRKEMEQCRRTKSQLKAAEKTTTRLQKRLTKLSGTS